MAFDNENHIIDPSGFQRHKDSGHLIGIEGAPPAAHPEVGSDFPKWVVPHASHVVPSGPGPGPHHVSTPDFIDYHVNRGDGQVTVLVHNEDEEAKALAPHRPAHEHTDE